jgi:hypothetical protein
MSEAIGFTLLGGSLNRLGRRFGLPGDGSNAIAVGAVLGGILWLVLMAVLIAEGALAASSHCRPLASTSGCYSRFHCSSSANHSPRHGWRSMRGT